MSKVEFLITGSAELTLAGECVEHIPERPVFAIALKEEDREGVAVEALYDEFLALSAGIVQQRGDKANSGVELDGRL